MNIQIHSNMSVAATLKCLLVITETGERKQPSFLHFFCSSQEKCMVRVVGCCIFLAFYSVPDPKRTKLGPRAIKSVFVGYAEHSKSYRLLDMDSGVLIESRDVVFF